MSSQKLAHLCLQFLGNIIVFSVVDLAVALVFELDYI